MKDAWDEWKPRQKIGSFLQTTVETEAYTELPEPALCADYRVMKNGLGSKSKVLPMSPTFLELSDLISKMVSTAEHGKTES